MAGKHEKVIKQCDQLQQKCANFKELEKLVSVTLTYKINDRKQQRDPMIALFEKRALEWEDHK